MSKRKLGQFGLVAGVPAVLLASTSALRAAGYQQIATPNGISTLVDTFDNPASFENNLGNGGAPGAFNAPDSMGNNWYNYSYGPPPNVRLDYGSATAEGTQASEGATETWVQNNSPDTTLGTPTSGSLQLAWSWNVAKDGDGSAAFTMDVLNTAQKYTSLSFDLYIDPRSTHGQYANDNPNTNPAGTSQVYPNTGNYEDYGYFQVFTKDQNYDQTEGAGGPDGTSLGDTDGNDPTTGLADLGTPLTSNGAGVWERYTVDLFGNAQNVRGITFQSYSQGESGFQALDLDNITLNAVPEPASLGMLALAGSSLLMRRRRHA